MPGRRFKTTRIFNRTRFASVLHRRHNGSCSMHQSLQTLIIASIDFWWATVLLGKRCPFSAPERFPLPSDFRPLNCRSLISDLRRLVLTPSCHLPDGCLTPPKLISLNVCNGPDGLTAPAPWKGGVRDKIVQASHFIKSDTHRASTLTTSKTRDRKRTVTLHEV